MTDLKNKNMTLMSTEEYIGMRKKAIRMLDKCQTAGEGFCVVGNQKVIIEEKDVLLNQLIGNYEYLKVPLELYLTNEFWRILKAESNKRIRCLKIQGIKEQSLCFPNVNNCTSEY